MSLTLEKIDEVLEQYEVWENNFDAMSLRIGSDHISDIPKKPHFEVTDKSSAEWVLRKIAKLTEQQGENNCIAEEQMKPLEDELDKIYDWKEGENNKLQNSVDFLKSLLEPYHRMILKDDPKAKTIKLPHGQMKIRAQQPEYQKNETEMVVSLKALDLMEFLKVKESPDWAKLKPLTDTVDGKVVHKETGAIIEGITAVERPDKFEVTVG